jgi:hypothetical protein
MIYESPAQESGAFLLLLTRNFSHFSVEKAARW